MLLTALGFLVGLVLAIAVLVLWAAGGLQSPRTFEVPATRLATGLADVSPGPAGDTITVVTWNTSWGYGWGSEGSGHAKPRAHFEESLRRMGEVLAAARPDIVLLQEVDFDATRSHHVDQAEVLARATGLTYVARAPSWRAGWVPFPYWPLSDHFGRMSSGGAVLSRFPITRNTVELLEKPRENAFLYNLFYLFRYLERVELDLDGTHLLVVNAHLEAFSAENRVRQAEHLRRTLDGGPLVLLGGDFNTAPPEQSRRASYPDEPETSHEDDRTLEIVRAIPGIQDSVPPDTFVAREPVWFTFPSHAPNRKLDYLLAGEGLEVLEARVLNEAGTLSDHLPLLVRLRGRGSSGG